MVTPYTRGPRFKSSHRGQVLWLIVEKTQIKKKEAGFGS